MTDIKSILNFAVARRPPLIPYNPIISYKKPAPDDAVIDPPTHDELRRIIAASCPHLVRAIMLSYYMGLRPGKVELFSITWDAVRWEHNYISVSAAAKGANKYKSRRPRHVPIHPALLPLLKIWHAQDHGTGHIISFRNKPITSISIAWSNALKRAGITRRIRPYDLRHVFITQAIEAGADMKSLSDIVGSRAQTLISSYQHVTKKMHRAAMDKIPILNVDDTGDTNKISPDVD